MSPESKKILVVIVIGIVMLLSFAVAFVVFVLAFQRKKFRNLQEKEQLKAEFQRELLRSSLEIQESTLQLVGRDLHDNIGPVLAVVRLSLASLQDSMNGEELTKAQGAEKLLARAMQDIRILSHTLNANRIQEKGMLFALKELAEQITQTGKFDCQVIAKSDKRLVEKEQEIILFRICQELVNNAIRHSDGNQILIEIAPSGMKTRIDVRDNGKGFSPESYPDGHGWSNIRKRAKILNAKFSVDSPQEGGTLASLIF